MLSRRRFLGAGSAGLLSLSTGCLPPDIQASTVVGWAPTPVIERKRAEIANKNHLLGYPINMNNPSDGFFAWRRELSRAGINAFAFNNVGNPFKQSPIPYNTHDYERDTIREFGRLFELPGNDVWGFLSHSGTDSNMHGMYMGRTLLTARTHLVPKAYFTREAHYSVQILRDLLGLEAVMVETLADGGMDPDDLADKLAEHASFPALVVATIGTTFKGAIDNLDQIRQKLRGRDCYVHLDAALLGGYLPFTQHAREVSCRIRHKGIARRYDSVAVSCHKFFGFPSPAGIFLTRKELYDEFNEYFSRIHNPEYIHHVPGTITCSRDAVKPAEFYYFTKPEAQAKLANDAKLMLETANHLFAKLRSDFPTLTPVKANALSNTVYFRHPGDEIVNKYSLATMHLQVDGKSEEFAHVVVMPHVSKEVIAEFLTDLNDRKVNRKKTRQKKI